MPSRTSWGVHFAQRACTVDWNDWRRIIMKEGLFTVMEKYILLRVGESKYTILPTARKKYILYS